AVEVVDWAACSSGAFRKNLKGFHWRRASFIVFSLPHRSWGIFGSVLTLWDDCKGHASGGVSEVCKPWRESKALYRTPACHVRRRARCPSSCNRRRIACVTRQAGVSDRSAVVSLAASGTH